MLECGRAGADIFAADGQTFLYPTYIQEFMGDIFSLGFGPFRCMFITAYTITIFLGQIWIYWVNIECVGSKNEYLRSKLNILGQNWVLWVKKLISWVKNEYIVSKMTILGQENAFSFLEINCNSVKKFVNNLWTPMFVFLHFTQFTSQIVQFYF